MSFTEITKRQYNEIAKYYGIYPYTEKEVLKLMYKDKTFFYFF